MMMSKKTKKISALFIVCILFLIGITLKSCVYATDDVTITFKDANMYKAMVDKLGSKISNKDEKNMQIQMTQTNIDAVKSLNLKESNISNIEGIEYFTNLLALTLNDNNISNISALDKLINLQRLYLYNNNITDVSALKGLTKLTNLSLENNKISNISDLKDLTNLKWLDLGKNEICDINALKGLSDLMTLRLNDNKIADISALTSLKNLDLNNLKLENQSFEVSAKVGETVDLPLIFKQIFEQSKCDKITGVSGTFDEEKTKFTIKDIDGILKQTAVKIEGGVADGTELSITIEPKLPEQTLNYKISYSTTEITNKDVVVTITSNLALKKVDGWNLSTDKLTLEKTYSKNTSTKITLTSEDGQEKEINIEINNIDKDLPEVKIEYSIQEETTENVIVTIKSNEKLQEIEGWQLSEDKKTAQKSFVENKEEIVTVKDLAGNEIKITVKVSNIVDKKENETKKDETKEEDTPKDDTIADTNIPYTGTDGIAIILIGSLCIIATIFCIRIKKYKNV